MKDFYYILGIDADSSLIEIKEAYRKLSKKFHPDLNPNDSYFEGRFKEIQEAYELLSDPAKRRRYDAGLAAFKTGATTRASKRSAGSIIWVDILFTLVLITITFVFGAYVKNAISGHSKKAVLMAAVNPAPPVIIKHHKKRHSLKLKLADRSVRMNQAVTVVAPVKAAAMPPGNPVPPPVKVAVVKPAPVQLARAVQPPVVTVPQKQVTDDTGDGPSPNKNFLYTTYIRSNITGVTNMHQSGSFSSAVVAAIPTNSQVFVLEKGDSYYKVLYNNSMGYVPKWSLKNK